jgi:hypothetical protein
LVWGVAEDLQKTPEVFPLGYLDVRAEMVVQQGVQSREKGSDVIALSKDFGDDAHAGFHVLGVGGGARPFLGTRSIGHLAGVWVRLPARAEVAPSRRDTGMHVCSA